MKAASVGPGTTVSIREERRPTPSADQPLINTKTFGINPKDWKVPCWTNTEHKSGDDFAGVVEPVGENVVEFRKGDRIAGFHVTITEGGAFGENALLPSVRAFCIPSTTTYEEVSAQQ